MVEVAVEAEVSISSVSVALSTNIKAKQPLWAQPDHFTSVFACIHRTACYRNVSQTALLTITKTTTIN